MKWKLQFDKNSNPHINSEDVYEILEALRFGLNKIQGLPQKNSEEIMFPWQKEFLQSFYADVEKEGLNGFSLPEMLQTSISGDGEKSLMATADALHFMLRERNVDKPLSFPIDMDEPGILFVGQESIVWRSLSAIASDPVEEIFTALEIAAGKYTAKQLYAEAADVDDNSLHP